MLTPYEIVDATEADLPILERIENTCFLAPWNREQILYEIKHNPVSNFWVIKVNGMVIGFSDYWNTFDSGTIAQIAILPEYQRHHFGSVLMEEILKDCVAEKVVCLTLEVRKGNLKAIAFYEKFGFKQILVKPHYYSNGEDAIYMIKNVEASK